MSIVKVREYLKDFGADGRILEFPVSSATVELAAKALGTAPARIAKTLSFRLKDGVILVVLAGDAKTDNRKYRETFGEKARMLDREEAETLVGHAVGGVCPFAVNEGVKVYLDVSLKRFATVFPAAPRGARKILPCLGLGGRGEASRRRRITYTAKTNARLFDGRLLFNRNIKGKNLIFKELSIYNASSMPFTF